MSTIETESENPKELLGTPYVVFAGWDDVPHLSESQKREFLKLIPPNLRPARTRGVPYLGAGAIYPVPLEDILEDPFRIPDGWPRVYALDTGWRRTAALWAAFDRDADVIHLYDEHYAGQAEPLIHAHAIMGSATSGSKLRARWIPGLIDPRARGRNEKDGTRLMKTYQDLGLDLECTNNAVEAGLTECWQRLSSGRLKVFRHLTWFQKEYCLYRRKEDGQIVKKNDHLMDCLIGHTRVITDHGSIPIRDLVGTSGLVMGPSGWNRYSDCRLYRKQSRVVSVRFEDGREVICTPDHLFMTTNGWFEAERIEGMDCYDVVSQATCRNYQSHTSLRPAKSLWGAATTFVENISSAMASGFTVPSGKLFIGQPCLVGTPFITKTPIDRTISQRILSWLSAQNIQRYTKKDTGDHCRAMLSMERRRGTVQMPAWSGIGTTIQSIWRVIMFGMSRRNAFSAVRPLPRQEHAEGLPDSVPMRARQHSAENQELTESKGAALLAAASSSLRQNIHPKSSAHGHVARAVRVVSVSPAGHADTYCLTAEPDAAFAVEGGILVHNCVRYIILSGAARAKSVQQNATMPNPDWGYAHSSHGWMGA